MRLAVWSAVLCCLLTATVVRPSRAAARVVGDEAPARAEPSRDAGASVAYEPPVDNAPVLDPFRPPASPYGPGNRGVDYAVAPGTPVRAAAAGEIVFAGDVAGSLHVVVLHADGIRTSYSFLQSVAVHRGDRVEAGDVVGLSGDDLHFGARSGDVYLDPLALFAGAVHVRLVPETAFRAGSEADERSGVARSVSGVARVVHQAGATAVGWARRSVDVAGQAVVGSVRAKIEAKLADARSVLDELRLWAHVLPAVGDLSDPAFPAQLLGEALWAWRTESGRPCTPTSVATPRLADRHLLVEVAGLASTTGDYPGRPDQAGSIADLDTAALGYLPGDVVEFSYRGGTTADNPYTAADTQTDLRDAGRRLRALLERLRAEHPGMTVDIVAHSQGGLVARSALGSEYATFDTRLRPIGTVVTIDTPHQGAHLATAAALVDHTRLGNTAEKLAGLVKPGGIDARSTAVRQLSETSSFIRGLNRRPVPHGVRLVSIDARGDLVVPPDRARLVGATNVVVDTGLGVDVHSRVVGSKAAARAVALAVTGAAPPCVSMGEFLVDQMGSAFVSRVEDAAGAALAGGAKYLEHRAAGGSGGEE